MEWRDDGIILGTRKHGESAVILEAFTRAHGRHKGYVHGGAGRRRRGVLQPGNVVSLAWRGRAPDSLGHFSVEPQIAHAAAIMALPGPLTALRSIAAMLARSLPEHDPHPGLYERLRDLLDRLAECEEADPAWGAALARFERDFLAEIGYGLDLSACAVTGETHGLAYVSPRTGRAVTEAGAGEFRDRLWSLPAFLVSRASADWPDVAAALNLTAHFLERFFAESDGRDLPTERYRLRDLVARKADARNA